MLSTDPAISTPFCNMYSKMLFIRWDRNKSSIKSLKERTKTFKSKSQLPPTLRHGGQALKGAVTLSK